MFMARLSPIPGSRRPFTEVSPLRFPVQADPILQVSAWLIILFTEYSPAPPFQVRSESRFLKFVRNFRDGLYYSIINVLGFPVPPPRLLLSPVPRDSFDILARLFFIVNNFFAVFEKPFLLFWKMFFQSKCMLSYESLTFAGEALFIS